MEFDIHFGIFVEMGAQLPVDEGRKHVAQGGDVGLRILGDQPRRHAFQRRPGGDQFDHFLLGLAHDIDAAPRHRAHETLALELGHCFAHRRPADAEILRKLALVEPDVGAAAVDVHRHDDVLQRGIGLVLEAERGVDRLDGEPMRLALRAARAGCRRPRNFGRVRIHFGRHAPLDLWNTIFQRSAQWVRLSVRQAFPGGKVASGRPGPQAGCSLPGSTTRTERSSPRIMMVETSPLEKNTPRLPCEPRIDCRKDSSAIFPSTSASTSGASG